MLTGNDIQVFYDDETDTFSADWRDVFGNWINLIEGVDQETALEAASSASNDELFKLFDALEMVA